MITQTTKGGKVVTLTPENYSACAALLQSLVKKGELATLRGNPLIMNELPLAHRGAVFKGDPSLPIDKLEIVPYAGDSFGIQKTIADGGGRYLYAWVIPDEISEADRRTYEAIREKCTSIGEAVPLFLEIMKNKTIKNSPTPGY